MHYLEEIRDLLKGFDKDIDELKRDIAIVKATMAKNEEVQNLKGQVTEMQRHNGRVIKVLAGMITVLLTALITVVGYLVAA